MKCAMPEGGAVSLLSFVFRGALCLIVVAMVGINLDQRKGGEGRKGAGRKVIAARPKGSKRQQQQQ